MDVERPKNGQPLAGVKILGGLDRGLAWIRLERSDAIKVVECLRRRIRRLSWLDEAGKLEFEEIGRASRMCYEISSTDGEAKLTSLSREDIDILYDLKDVEIFLNATLNKIRDKVRPSGPVDPIIADQMAKGLLDLMEC